MKPDPTTQPVLDVISLSVTVNKNELLSDISFSVNRGDWVGIIGPNGAGKTTLLKALASLLDYEGQISVPADLSKTPSSSAAQPRRAPTAKDIAMVSQRPVIPAEMTVAEYVLLGRSAHISWFGTASAKDRRISAEVIELLNLESFVERNVSELSGGECQRVVLARALAQQSPILLLDEPTSALDIGHEVDVLELVDELRLSQELTVISVMHDLGSAARYAQKLCLIDSGQLAIFDSSDTVVNSDELAEVYGSDLRVIDVDGEIFVLPPPRRKPSNVSRA